MRDRQEQRIDQHLLDEARRLLANPYIAIGNGTKALATALQAELTLAGSSHTPSGVISELAQREETMELLGELWQRVERGERGNFPFVLAVLHSQLPIENMSPALSDRVANLPRVPYAIDTFSDQIFCEKSEGYLAGAVNADMVGSDSSCFLLKSSRAGAHFGFTGGVTSRPAIATGGNSDVVIVPYVWYRPQRHEDKELLSQQLVEGGRNFSLPNSRWQVVRQFDELDFSQMSGETLQRAQARIQGGRQGSSFINKR